MASYQHDLRDIVRELDAKLKELERQLGDIPDVPANKQTRSEMSERIAAGLRGRKELLDCCCIAQICNFNWVIPKA